MLIKIFLFTFATGDKRAPFITCGKSKKKISLLTQYNLFAILNTRMHNAQIIQTILTDKTYRPTYLQTVTDNSVATLDLSILNSLETVDLSEALLKSGSAHVRICRCCIRVMAEVSVRVGLPKTCRDNAGTTSGVH